MMSGSWNQARRSLVAGGLLLTLSSQIALVPRSEAQSATPLEPAAVLAQARELIKAGEYNETIELLVSAREGMRADPALLAENYLLLIKTYVFIGNDLAQQPQGRPTADLSYEKASALIEECLSIRELRHTRAEPESDYPPEMVQRFRAVRDRVQGALRITELVPPNATVVLDGDTLQAPLEAAALEASDLAVGEHAIEVHAAGHVSRRENIQIAAGTTLDRQYTLKVSHGFLWYATRIGAATAAVVTAVLVVRSGGSSGESNLPDPPPPPTGPDR